MLERENTTIVSVELVASADDLWQWLVYIVQGVIVFSTNFMLFLTFCKHEALQNEKEYIFVMGLAFGDAMNGLGYIAAGVDRSWVVLDGTYNDKVTSWDCMLTLYNLLWLWTDCVGAFMLLAISIDRLLAATLLMSYIMWSCSYAQCFVLCGYVYAFTWGAVGFIAAYLQPADQQIYPRVCISYYAMGDGDFFGIQYLFNMSCMISSIICYFFVWVFHKRYFKSYVNNLKPHEAELKRRVANQRKMTTSLAISSLFTFVFCLLPFICNTIILKYYVSNKSLMSLSMILWMTYNINPMLNFVILVTRHRVVRVGLKAVIECKDLPGNIELWAAVGTSASMSTTRRSAW